MAIKVPEYNRQVSPDVAKVQNAPSVPHLDLSGGLSGINKIGAANQEMADTGVKIAGMLAKHAQEQQDLKNQAWVADSDTSFRKNLQTRLLSDADETIKVNGQDVTRKEGILNRVGNNTDGSTVEFRDWYIKNREEYLKQSPNLDTRTKLAKRLDDMYLTSNESVIKNEVKQKQAALVGSYTSSIKQQVEDAYALSDPRSLNMAIDNALQTQADLNRAIGADENTSKLAMNKTTDDLVENSVLGKLKGTGNSAESISLLDSVKYKLSPERYDDLKDTIIKTDLQNKKQAEQVIKFNEAKTLEEIDTRIVDGDMDITKLNEYRGKISDKDFLQKKEYILSGKMIDPVTKVDIYNKLQDEFVSLGITDEDKTDANLAKIATFRNNVMSSISKGEITKAEGKSFLDDVSVAFDAKTADALRSKYHWWETMGNWAERNADNIAVSKARLTQEFRRQTASGVDPQVAVQNVILQEHLRMNPQDATATPETILDRTRPKDLTFTPALKVVERIGKGLGTGVAGTVEGFGGALKWLGAKDAGKMVSAHADKMKEFYAVPDPKFADQVAAGFGSMGTFFIPGLGIARGVQIATAMPRLAAWLGIGASTALEATVEAGSTYERALEKDMTGMEASNAASKAFWLNIPTLAITNRLGLFGDKGGLLVKSLKSSGFEGFQEFSQSIIGNMVVNDPALEGAFESAAVGAITGGGMGLAVNAAKSIEELKQGKEIKDNFEPPTQEPPSGGDIAPDEPGPLPTYEGDKAPVTDVSDVADGESVQVPFNSEEKVKLPVVGEDNSVNSATEEVSLVPRKTGGYKDIVDSEGNVVGEVGYQVEETEAGQEATDFDIKVTGENNIGTGSNVIEKVFDSGVDKISGTLTGKNKEEARKWWLNRGAKVAGDNVVLYKEDFKGAKQEILGQDRPKGTRLSSESGSITIPDLPKLPPEVRKDINAFTDASFVPLSTRLAKIDPRLRDVMRKFEFNKGLTTHRNIQQAAPFMNKLEAMPVEESSKLDMALKNVDIETINEIVDRNNIRKEYEEVRSTLDDIYNRAKEVGLDVSYIDDYFPRRVNDVEGFLDYLKNSENWSAIDKAIKAEEKATGAPMNSEERAEFINKMLRGYGDSQLRIAKPSNTKSRKIQILDENMNAFYKNSNTTLQEYIVAMESAIAARKFFGLGGKNVEDSIGAYVRDLVDNGIITHEQEKEVRAIVDARFKERGTRGIWNFYKNLGYIYTMGSPISAITQIGDLAFSLYENGFYDSAQGLKSTFSKNKITKQKLGIDPIIEEFSDRSKAGKAVTKIFKLIGLEAMDNMGKETIINGAMNKLSREANANNPELDKELKRVFGSEANKVKEDLKAKEPSDDVKYLLFSRLAKYQPIALSEMPEYYSKGGNLRILYMLKSYTIKQLDVFHNEVFMQMKTDPKKAFGNLVKLAAALAAMNAGADVIKDVLLGRPIKLADVAVDNILRLVGFSKYTLYKAKKEGLIDAAYSTVLPPVPFIDDILRDMKSKKKEVKDYKIWNSLPFVGKFYYWWFGGGREVIEKEERKKRKKSSQ